MSQPPNPAHRKEIVVKEASGNPYSRQIIAGGHVLQADEPTDLGGADTGPTPYDLLCASLGACISITTRMVAQRKQWPLESIEVRVTHEKRPATGENKKTTVDVFHKSVKLTGDLTAKQRQRLLEIADKCPIHRTLTSCAVEMDLTEI